MSAAVKRGRAKALPLSSVNAGDQVELDSKWWDVGAVWDIDGYRTLELYCPTGCRLEKATVADLAKSTVMARITRRA